MKQIVSKLYEYRKDKVAVSISCIHFCMWGLLKGFFRCALLFGEIRRPHSGRLAKKAGAHNFLKQWRKPLSNSHFPQYPHRLAQNAEFSPLDKNRFHGAVFRLQPDASLFLEKALGRGLAVRHCDNDVAVLRR